MTLTEAQLEMRRSFIGASEAAAVLGISSFSEPLDVYAAKVLGVFKPGTLAMELGHFTEPLAIARYCAKRGIDRSRLFYPGTIRHHKHPHIAATPDAGVWCADPTWKPGDRWPSDQPLVIVEAKYSDRFNAKQYWSDAPDGFPDEYRVQVEIQMAVTGARRAELVAILGGEEDIRIYPVEHDEELCNAWIEKLTRFWFDHVEARVPPAPQTPDSARRFLKKLYPAHRRGVLLPPTEERRKLVANLRAAKASLEAADYAVQMHRVALEAELGDAEGIEGLCTFKTQGPCVVPSFTKAAGRVLRLAKETR